VLGPAPNHDRGPDRRLRVGYVSPDFLQHIVAHFIDPVLAHHDPRAVEAVCYSDVLLGDAVTERLRTLSHRWRLIHGKSDEEVAALVRSDAVDILVDLAGHTGGRLGLFARRPASGAGAGHLAGLPGDDGVGQHPVPPHGRRGRPARRGRRSGLREQMRQSPLCDGAGFTR
jgi:hypothetical protein